MSCCNHDIDNNNEKIRPIPPPIRPIFCLGPTGPTGPTGPSGGATGPTGPTGPAPTFAIGTVTTGAPGSNAEVTITSP